MNGRSSTFALRLRLRAGLRREEESFI